MSVYDYRFDVGIIFPDRMKFGIVTVFEVIQWDGHFIGEYLSEKNNGKSMAI